MVDNWSSLDALASAAVMGRQSVKMNLYDFVVILSFFALPLTLKRRNSFEDLIKMSEHADFTLKTLFVNVHLRKSCVSLLYLTLGR